MRVNLLQGTCTPTLTPMPGVHNTIERTGLSLPILVSASARPLSVDVRALPWRASYFVGSYRGGEEEHSQDEDRWITLGLDRTGTLLVVCHTYREETEVSARIRLISARKAAKNEAKQYVRE